MNKRIVIVIGAISLCCCGNTLPLVSADRAAITLTNYYKSLQVKRAAKKQKQLEEKRNNKHPYETTRRRKGGGPTSFLVRSFILACMFWVIRLAMPQFSVWIRQLCRDISQFSRSLDYRHHHPHHHHRRRKKQSQQQDKETRRKRKETTREQLDSSFTSTLTPSPSVQSIIEMGDANQDDGSSFISATSAITSFSSYIGSFAKGRRRQKITSERVAHSNHKHSSTTTTTKTTKSKSSKASNSSSRSKPQQIDEEKGYTNVNTTKSKLHFMEDGNGTTTNNQSGNIDDVSCLPIVGNVKPNEGYGLLLEGKASSGSYASSSKKKQHSSRHAHHGSSRRHH